MLSNIDVSMETNRVKRLWGAGRASVSGYHGITHDTVKRESPRTSWDIQQDSPVIKKDDVTALQASGFGPWDDRVQLTDVHVIQQVSYCPTIVQMHALCDRGRLAVSNPYHNIKSAVFVKGPTEPIPTENILSKSVFFNGNGPHGLNTIAMGDGGDFGPFAFIRDFGKFPYHYNSMGLIGVLRTFHESVYGNLRINIFQGKLSEVARRSLVQTIRAKDEHRVREMLIDFLDFRNKHVLKLLAETVSHMTEQEHMMSDEHTAVRDLLRHCAAAPDFSHTGLGVVSFCQSWDTNDDGTVSDRPCFSIASPHFQTRFYVRDGQRLKLYLSGVVQSYEVVDTMFKKYQAVMLALARRMQNAGYNKTFVNLDALRKLLGTGAF